KGDVMSLFDTREFERDIDRPPEEQYIDLVRPSDTCFKCGGPLTDNVVVRLRGCSPFVYYVNEHDWKNDPQVWLHADLAHDMALDLLREYMEVKEVRDRIAARKKFGLPIDPKDEEFVG